VVAEISTGQLQDEQPQWNGSAVPQYGLHLQQPRSLVSSICRQGKNARR